MAEQAKKEIEEILLRFVEFTKKGEYEKIASLYTENGTLMPHGADPIVGRDNIKEFCIKVVSGYNEAVFEKIAYFELISDNAAYSNFFYEYRDKQGKSFGLFQDAILWKKVDGKWYIDRDIFNNRPSPPTPESTAKKQIEARINTLYDAFNNDDYDAAMAVYAEGATVLPHDGDMITGKEAIKPVYREVIPEMKKLVVEEMYYFELLSDNTAYTNSHMKSVDDSGKLKAVFRDCLMWTKIDGEWYIRRDMFNDRPLPKE